MPMMVVRTNVRRPISSVNQMLILTSTLLVYKFLHQQYHAIFYSRTSPLLGELMANRAQNLEHFFPSRLVL
jgi:hypothetical protein